MAKPTEQLDKLEALYRINESILSILEIDTLLDRILHIMEDTFGFDSCAILFLDETSSELYIRAARGYCPKVIQEFRTTAGGRGITGHVAKTREPLFISDLDNEPRYVSGVENASCEIAFPLVVEEHLIGVLDIESRQKHSFSDGDFDVLAVFSSQIALAIHNAHAFENERRHASQLEVFNEIRKRISVSLDLDKLLEVAANSMIEFLKYYQIMVFLKQEKTDKLRLMAHAGLEELDIDGSIYERLPGGIVEAAFLGSQTQVVREIKTSPFRRSVVDDITAELAIPLTIQQRTVGVLYIASRSSGGAFNDKDVHILETICEQLTVIMKDAAAFSHISKKSKHFEIIRKISQVAIQSFDLHKFIGEIVRLTQKVFGFYSVSVFTFEPVSRELELISCAGAELESLQIGDKLPLDDGIVGLVARSKQVQVCNDVIRDAAYKDVLLATKSELTVPIMHEDEVLGVMNIESPQLNGFDDSDIDTFTRIADQIAYTITNAALFQQKTSAHNLLLNLNDLSRQINSTFDLDNTITTVVRELPAVVDCRLCSVFSYDKDREELILMGHNLPAVASDGPISLHAADNALMGKVIELKRSVHVKNIEQELNIENRPRYQTKSFLNIILSQEDRILGVLNLTDKIDGSYFSSEEFYLVNSFAEHVANAITNSKKYQQILELSVTDGLTGLFVHRYFQESLMRETSRAMRHHLPLALVMLDVDDFKHCNDKFGHQVGDIVLRELALIVKDQIREYDIAARYGGDEFSIIMPSTTIDEASALANRLRRAIETRVVVTSHRQLRVTVSQGVAEFVPGFDKETLLHRADFALLEAKRTGKNKIVVFSEDMADL